MPGYLVNGHHDAPLEIPGTGGKTVVLKSSASYGDDLRVDVAAAQQGAPVGVPLSEADQLRYGQARMRTYVLERTAVMIVSWDLEDEAGKPLPITPATLAGLSVEVGNWLATEARLRFEGRAQGRSGPFAKPSSPPSAPDTPRTPK